MNFNNIPIVTKYLIIINVIVFAFTGFLAPQLHDLFSMRFFGSPEFGPWQLITAMFTHADGNHLFFNMFTLFIFGAPLERALGDKDFLKLYFISGLGAIMLRQGVYYIEYQNLLSLLPENPILHLEKTYEGFKYPSTGDGEAWRSFGHLMFGYGRGASGAIFGVLVGFGMLFPNVKISPLFMPFGIEAKYLITLFIIIELYLQFTNAGSDGIGHLAHLGGALFGFIMIKIWKKDKTIFY